MIRSMSHLLLYVSVTFLLAQGTGSSAWAESLLEYVRADAGLCVRIENPAKWEENWNASEFRHRLLETDFHRDWTQSRDVREMRKTIAELDRLLGSSFTSSFLNLLGNEVVLAVYPQATPRPTGVLLSAPRNLEQARELIALWNRLDAELVEEVSEGYWKRESAQGQVLYYMVQEGLFALSDREAVIRQLAVDEKPKDGILSTESLQRASASLGDLQRAVVYFRPERWKGVIEQPARTDTFEGVVFQQLASADSVVLGISDREGIRTRLNLLYKPDREPEELIEYRQRHALEENLWRNDDESQLAIVAGRGGPEYLSSLYKQSLPHQSARTGWIMGRELIRGLLLGRDPFDDLLPSLGHVWSLEFRSLDDTTIPWGMKLDLSVSEEAAISNSPSLQASLSNLVETGMRMLSQTPGVSTSGIAEKSIENGTDSYSFQAPLGLSPTVALESDRIRIVSSKDLLVPANERPSATNGILDSTVQSGHWGLRLHPSRIANSLNDHFGTILRLKNVDPESPNAVKTRTRLTEMLGLVDQFSGTVSFKEAEIRLELEAVSRGK